MKTPGPDSDASQRTDVPSLEEAYFSLRPLFYHALSAVAREGFSVPPSDSKDVIHSFLIDTWSSIEANYDSDRSALQTYVYTAFKRYARRLASRRDREVQQSVDRKTLEALASSGHSTPEEFDTERSIDEALLKEAIDQLPDEEAKVLRLYLSTLSERQVASELGTTRHHVHQRLIRAIGKLALHFDTRPSGVSREAWDVTRLVLNRGYTVAQAAHSLGLPPRRAKRLHEGVLSNLLFRVRSMLTHNTSTPTMPETASTMDLKTITRALQDGDVDTLESLKDYPDDVLEYIDSEHVFDVDDVSREVADVFHKVVAHAAEQQAETVEVDEAVSVTAAEENAVGVAFSTLVDHLEEYNDDLTNFEWLVEEEPDASPNYRDALLEQPSFESAPDEMRTLATSGLSPLNVFYGVSAVPNLLYRMRKQGFINSNENIVLATLNSWKDEPELDVQPEKAELRYFVKEIELSMSCTPVTARRFFDWMIRVADISAFLFSGYCAVPDSESSADTALRLISSSQTFSSLGEQWTTPLTVEHHTEHELAEHELAEHDTATAE